MIPVKNAMNTFKTLDIPEICSAVSNTENALIICHTNPDGDTLGCALAMRKIFSLLGKKSKIVCPSQPPQYLSFVTCGESFEYTVGDEDGRDLIMSLDVASEGQLGALAFLKDKISVMIDHHSSGYPFADNLIVPSASAAGEIVYKIYESLCRDKKIARSSDVCRYLYTAISSDTGSFKYSNTTPETLMIAAKLMEEINSGCGMHTDEIARLLHDTVSKTDIAVAAAVNASTVFFEDGSLAVALITNEEMKKGGFCENDLGGAVDIPRKIENVLVSVALKQRADNPKMFKISSRANCDIDVAAVCRIFGGGGHIRAAGASVEAESPADALRITADAFSSAVSEYKNKISK